MYNTKVLKRANRRNIKWKKILFYSVLMAIPVIQISLFYVYVNLSSFAMAFRSYSKTSNGLVYSYSISNLVNFKNGWNMLVSNSTRIRNTFIYFIFNLLINIPLALLSSFYFYRKKHASGFFKVMLFMPQVLSSIVLAFIYKEIFEVGVRSITGNEEGFLFSIRTGLWAVIIFNLVMSFGVNVLIYSSTMSGINESIIESSQIDGCNSFRQFVSIIIPMIYPTIVSLLVVSISCFFTNQYNVFTLVSDGQGSSATTNIGHFLYCQNLTSNYYVSTTSKTSILDYPELASVGLILTFIILPISLISRWALNKFGPRAD